MQNGLLRNVCLIFSYLFPRFPVVEKIRYDKSPMDCMTLKGLEDLKKDGLAKRSSENDTNEVNDEPKPKKRKPNTTKKQHKLDPIYRPLSNDGIKTASKILEGKIIVVEHDVRSNVLKEKLEKIIIQHGGTVEANPRIGRTWAFIQTIGNITAKNAIKAEAFNVIKHNWLLECDDGKFQPLR